MTQYLKVEMPDGSCWGVPVAVIARNRAECYKDEFGGDVERSLTEDTMLLFMDEYEILDWASNNMNWDEVEQYAIKLSDRPAMTARSWQKGWVDGDREIVEVDE